MDNCIPPNGENTRKVVVSTPPLHPRIGYLSRVTELGMGWDFAGGLEVLCISANLIGEFSVAGRASPVGKH